MTTRKKTTTAPDGGGPSAELKFEQALERLETIVAEMEAGDLDLETMIARFEEGRRHLKSCSAKLDEVERRIEMLVKQDDGVKLVPFEPESGDDGLPRKTADVPAEETSDGGHKDELPF